MLLIKMSRKIISVQQHLVRMSSQTAMTIGLGLSVCCMSLLVAGLAAGLVYTQQNPTCPPCPSAPSYLIAYTSNVNTRHPLSKDIMRSAAYLSANVQKLLCSMLRLSHANFAKKVEAASNTDPAVGGAEEFLINAMITDLRSHWDKDMAFINVDRVTFEGTLSTFKGLFLEITRAASQGGTTYKAQMTVISNIMADLIDMLCARVPAASLNLFKPVPNQWRGVLNLSTSVPPT